MVPSRFRRRLVLAGLLGGGVPAAWAAEPVRDERLFVALGGRPGIDALMDDFVPRLVADAQIGRHFKSTNREHLARQLAAQVCQLAGGPCTYEGPAMGPAHEGMGITRADFNRLVELLQASMAARGVPFGAQNRLLALLAPMHREIVEPR
jgi:hemoglobin